MKPKHFIISIIVLLAYQLISCQAGINFVSRLLISHSEYNFGNVRPGLTSSKDFLISNPGVATLKINGLELTNFGIETTEPEFTITQVLNNTGKIIEAPYNKISIKPLDNIIVTVTFTPQSTQIKTADLSITHNDKRQLNPSIINLSGNTTQISVDPAVYDFGVLDIGESETMNWTILNVGEDILDVYSIEFPDSNEYTLIFGLNYFKLAPDLSEMITVQFKPTNAGLRKAIMRIRHNGVSSPTDIILTGIGKPHKNYPPYITDTNSSPDITKADSLTIVTFTANVEDPNGLNDIQSVVIDLQNFGSNIEQMFDDGTNGDEIAGDGIFTYQFIVPDSLGFGNYTAEITATDYSGATFARIVSLLIWTGNKIYVSDSRGDDTTGNGTETAPFKTIQKGIDSSSDYDWVSIEDGEYIGVGNRDLDFSSGTSQTKEIIVKSEFGPEVTIINCEGSPADNHIAFIFETGETNNAIIAGLKIINGYNSTNGGAIISTNSSPTIKDCIFENNESAAGGGAIACINSAAVISDSLIKNNKAIGGGGIWIQNCSNEFKIYNNIIESNTALLIGGGIYLDQSSPIIANNNVVKNKIEPFMFAVYGGGIAVTGNLSAPKIERCNISYNVVSNSGNTSSGGGIYYSSNSTTGLVISDCKIDNNEIISSSNNSYGAGLYLFSNSTVKIRNTFIRNNKATGQTAQGSGIYSLIRVKIEIDDCEFSGNSIIAFRSGSGGAIFMNYSSFVDIIDSHFFNNIVEANENALGGCFYFSYDCMIDIKDTEISSNKADGINAYGGAIYLLNDSEINLYNCQINKNTADANLSYAGAIYLGARTIATLHDTTLEGNLSRSRSTTAFGGAISTAQNVTLNIDNSKLSNNSAQARTTSYGGAISLDTGTNLIINKSYIEMNISRGAASQGGAIRSNDAIISVSSCYVVQNIAIGNTSARGGAFWLFNTATTIQNSLISDNKSEANSDVLGGALFIQSQITNIFNSTITQNLCQSYNGVSRGGAFYLASVTASIKNSIVWDNFVLGGPTLSGNEIYNTGSTVSADFCNVANTTKNSVADIFGTVTFSNSIHENPFFIDPYAQNYRLEHTSLGFFNDSPCIDTGSNTAVPIDITEDLDGNPRIADGTGDGSSRVDMGCYEKQ